MSDSSPEGSRPELLQQEEDYLASYEEDTEAGVDYSLYADYSSRQFGDIEKADKLHTWQVHSPHSDGEGGSTKPVRDPKDDYYPSKHWVKWAKNIHEPRNHFSLPEKEREYTLSENNPYTTPGLVPYNKEGLKYNAAQRVAAVQGWLVSGSFKEAERLSGVKAGQVRRWKFDAAWFPEVVKRLKAQQQDSIEAMLNGLVQKSLGQLHERLETGDEVITKDGGTAYVKIKAKDLASIIAQAQLAKKNLTENQQDATKEVTTMQLLEEKLRQIAKNELGATVVATQSE
jgi:hypothetical protein